MPNDFYNVDRRQRSSRPLKSVAEARSARRGSALATTLDQLLTRAAAEWGDQRSIIFDDSRQSFSFRELEECSRAVVDELLERGVGAGDRVCVILRNSPAYPVTWLAITRMKAVMVPINAAYRKQDAGYIVNHAEPRVIVASQDHEPLVTDLIENARRPLVPLYIDEELRHLGSASTHSLSDRPFPEDLANIQYTSGTTGQPKGCMLSHAFWSIMAERLVDEFPCLTDEDTLLTAQPFSYIDPQWNVAAALRSGASLVVLDRFHPSTFWERVRRHHVTFFYCLGAMPNLLLKTDPHPDDRTHNVRAVTCSGIPRNLHAELEARWGVPWYEVFGMTETGNDLRVSPEEQASLVGSGCIGRPLRHREARVIDDEGRPVRRGDIGELVLRGIGMMDGYFKDELATNTAFRDSWLHTGDHVIMDDDGRIYYVSRQKDMIRRSGENVSAAEVEAALQEHGAVRLAACVATPDELRGEEIVAYIVFNRHEGTKTIGPHELAHHCRERLAYFKVPRYWIFVADLPRTPSERVAKGQLKEHELYRRAPRFDIASGEWEEQYESEGSS